MPITKNGRKGSQMANTEDPAQTGTVTDTPATTTETTTEVPADTAGSVTYIDPVTGAQSSTPPAEPAADVPAYKQTDYTDFGGEVHPSDEEVEQYKKDNQARIDNPDTVVVRGANPEFGGESF